MPCDLKTTLRPVVSRVRRVAYRGATYECPCCLGAFRRLLTTGTPPRPNTVCPACGSMERHRLLALLIRRLRPELASGRVLHFAPEKSVASLFSGAAEYKTTDLEGDVDVHADITDLPFPDESWDLAVCSHVLEHVANDRKALHELRRVLSPSGSVIIMVPQEDGNPVTDEDPNVTDVGERIRRFGQADHVRLYGHDLYQRLEECGFSVVKFCAEDHFSEQELERHRLLKIGGGFNEVMLICTPAAQ